jgi:hypothetical protein
MPSDIDNKITIYIRLLNEGSDAFRPTTAEPMGGGLFKVLATPSYDPTNEEWEFLPEAIVQCQHMSLYEGAILVDSLVAVANINDAQNGMNHIG